MVSEHAEAYALSFEAGQATRIVLEQLHHTPRPEVLGVMGVEPRTGCGDSNDPFDELRVFLE